MSSVVSSTLAERSERPVGSLNLTPNTHGGLLMRRYLFGGVLPALLALVVLAAPAAASASPKLEYAGGGAVPVGAPVKSVSTNLVFGSSSGSFMCATSTLEGKLATNSGSAVVDEVETTSFVNSTGGPKCATTWSGPITFALQTSELPLCLSSTSLGSATLRPCGSGAFEFHMQLYNSAGVFIGGCNYGLEKLETTYKSSSPLVLTLSAGQTMHKLVGSSILCPAQFTDTGSFTVTSGGSQLKIS
jgi:hypothetical protein